MFNLLKKLLRTFHQQVSSLKITRTDNNTTTNTKQQTHAIE